MADLSRFKRKSLGAPPPIEQASSNLSAPETAPVAPSDPPIHTEARQSHPAARGRARKLIDGRSLRKTGRTVPFATRISMEFEELLHKIAKRDGLMLVEVLEKGVIAYEAARKEKEAR